MAKQVNEDMFRELSDLIISRRRFIKIIEMCGPGDETSL
jgi:hypothetical protein